MLLNKLVSRRQSKKAILCENRLEIYQGGLLTSTKELCGIVSINYRLQHLSIAYNRHRDEEGDMVLDCCIIYNVDEFLVKGNKGHILTEVFADK